MKFDFPDTKYAYHFEMEGLVNYLLAITTLIENKVVRTLIMRQFLLKYTNKVKKNKYYFMKAFLAIILVTWFHFVNGNSSYIDSQSSKGLKGIHVSKRLQTYYTPNEQSFMMFSKTQY